MADRCGFKEGNKGMGSELQRLDYLEAWPCHFLSVTAASLSYVLTSKVLATTATTHIRIQLS